jgi:hypothetical protein
MVRLTQLESRTAGLLHHIYKYTYAPRVQLYLLVLQHYQVLENSPTVTLQLSETAEMNGHQQLHQIITRFGCGIDVAMYLEVLA